MKILITGTHLTPALAVIEELKKIVNAEIIYMGRSSTLEGDSTKSVESQVLNKLGIKFIPIISGRLQRTFTSHTIPSLFKIPVGFIQSLYFLFKEKPDVVLSFGGYISVPVVVCAWFLSIPIIVHEQTLIPGLANTINSWFASRVAVSFPENVFFKKNNIVFTGNPLRKEVLTPKNSNDKELNETIGLAKNLKQPLILITGGNQGSHIINQNVSKNLDELTKIACIIHQTGDSKYKDFDKLLLQKNNLKNPEKYLVRKWIDSEEWGFLLKKVDMVVSRAGINTLLELSFNAIPTIVIPLPKSHNKEQSYNAEFFEKSGLVKILPQDDLTKDILLQNILEIISDLNNWKKKASNASEFVIPDAAKRLALEVILLAKKR